MFAHLTKLFYNFVQMSGGTFEDGLEQISFAKLTCHKADNCRLTNLLPILRLGLSIFLFHKCDCKTLLVKITNKMELRKYAKF